MHQAWSPACSGTAGRALGTGSLCAACSGAVAARVVDDRGPAGGNVRSSAAPSRPIKRACRLERGDASSLTAPRPTLSSPRRGARRRGRADQVLVVFLKADYTLEPADGWDALGMRGTCSAGFKLDAPGRGEQMRRSRTTASTRDACCRCASVLGSGWMRHRRRGGGPARAFVRSGAPVPTARCRPGAAHLTKARASLQTLRSPIAGALRSSNGHASEPGALKSIDFQPRINFIKVKASELAVATVMSASTPAGSPAIATTTNSASAGRCATSCRRRS